MLASTGFLLALVAGSQGADWPGLLGPDRDGKSPEKGVLTRWPAAGPRLVWQRDLGESFGPCSVARGRAFHLDRFDDKIRLTCLKARTGEELWRHEYATDYVDPHSDNNGPRCPPVVDGDRVYGFDPAGVLFCVRAADGALAWKVDTAKDFGVAQNFFGVGSTPVIEGDLLIAQVGGRGGGSGIVAFDKATGKARYKATDELASYSSPVCATVGGRRWGFLFARGGLVGFDPATGKVDFHQPWRARAFHTVNVSNPVVVGDRVFVSEAYGIGSLLVKVRPGGCEVLWSGTQAMEAYWHTPIHVDGHLYGSSGLQGADAELRCVELATGKVKWKVEGLTQCGLLHVDGHFVSLNEHGVLRLVKVNPERYEEVATVELKGLRYPVRAAPVLSHGLLYVRGKDKLLCLELIPGHPLPAEERGRLRRSFDDAVARWTRAVDADPRGVDAYSRRGDARFFRGDFREAVADYEKMVELDGTLAAPHWRRGIAYFYAGEYEKAAGQFEAYHSHDDVDRENGIWRYFSQAKAYGLEKARQGLLKYEKDDREPFPAVYQLFAGKTSPDEILKAIRSAKVDDSEREKRLFYAHLYIGLHHAVEGKPAQALPHLREAVANAWGPHAGTGPAYMWQVGRLHYELLSGK